MFKNNNIYNDFKTNFAYIFLIGMFVSIYNTRFLERPDLNNNDINLLFLFSYGSLDIPSIKYIVPLFIFLLPQMYLIHLFGDYLPKNFHRYSVYIFTRTENRTKWVLNNLKQLFINVCIYYLILFLCVSIVGILKGLRIDSYSDLIIILYLYILVIVFNYFLLLLTNSLSIFLNSTYSYIITIFLHIFSMLLFGATYELPNSSIFFIRLLPSVHSILTWHNINIINHKYSIINDYIDGFYITHSILYILSLSFIIIFIVLHKLKRMDII
ncbi:hypothetical protein ABV89_14720 [Priestia aryabhattai]|nr:hypothetical protein VL11_27035 [Priestia aryabhattai]KMN98939.1 hypothetical protein ABV89_14720 [Priestia aryabhattai]